MKERSQSSATTLSQFRYCSCSAGSCQPVIQVHSNHIQHRKCRRKMWFFVFFNPPPEQGAAWFVFLFVWSLPKKRAGGHDLGLPHSQQWQPMGLQTQKYLWIFLLRRQLGRQKVSQITRVTGAVIRWGWKLFGAKLLEELLSDLMCQQGGLRCSSGCDLSSKGWDLEFSKYWEGAVKRLLRWVCGYEGRIESVVCSDPNPVLLPLLGSLKYYFILPMFSFSLFRWGVFLGMKTSLHVKNPQTVSRTL